MRNGAVSGVGGIVEDVVELRARINREHVVADVGPSPVGQEDSRTDT